MLLLATGSLLVMVDLDMEGKPIPSTGLFRAFRSVTSLRKWFGRLRVRFDSFEFLVVCDVLMDAILTTTGCGNPADTLYLV